MFLAQYHWIRATYLLGYFKYDYFELASFPLLLFRCNGKRKNYRNKKFNFQQH